MEHGTYLLVSSYPLLYISLYSSYVICIPPLTYKGIISYEKAKDIIKYMIFFDKIYDSSIT